jgi:7,8-dihydropterin-6-yl-methyl-4-(beta-D-ribofuranosyl)aminobenzene 5'-phosphate synthase
MQIVFDNYIQNDSCKSLWGFGMYLKEYKLLFDTGSNGRVLLHNIKELNIDIKEIEYIFLTHSHWDHIGGLDSILELNNNITIFAPSSLSPYLLKDLQSLTKEVILCNEKPKKLFSNLYTTGILGKGMKEQSLIIDDDYPKVISGCGHYGIKKIVEKSRHIISKNIKLVIGGFHMIDKEEEYILQSIKELKSIGVKEVIPTHCTGDEAIKLYKKYFDTNYSAGGVGKVIDLDN